jgi:23S rRNA A2030 N6-methylase RlmJ
MYDHSNKIGNRGDLIKHFALTVATKEIATGKASFSYLDVHSGRSTYDLPDSGEWKTGIGKFAEHYSKQNSLSADLRYFFQVQSVADVPQTRKHAGSSRIVLNVLQDVGVKRVKPILCDTNSAVCKDLEIQLRDIPSVEICCADGYQKAHDVEDVDLLFIDPPDIRDHYQPFLKLISTTLLD